ncbi:oligopeptide ABC transporter permease [Ferroacidibacillus organovorans]|uniref:oligopeptide ABC transporter permease n=1 Tax=Ferroacidibacillus organovorans TaxID=1765683 RepID=UPI0015C4A6A6|nr:oligopeptide ABC transporter permease [Ferroacidibacillus organovorans]
MTSGAVIETQKPSAANKVKPVKSKSPTRLSLERFFRNPLAVSGLVIFCIILFLTIAAPLFTHFSPSTPDIMNTDSPPTALHPLGTDGSGYDNLARVLYGGRTDLTIAFVAAFAQIVLGVIYGGISGFFGGWVDNILMRFVDIMLNFPFISLVLVLEAIFNTSSMWMLVLVVSITSWPGTARFMRGVFLQLREQDYVVGARTIGCSTWRIIFRHMLPNSTSILVVLTSFTVAGYVGINAALSYLGLGVPPSTPSWGGMLNSYSDYLSLKTEPYAWMPPALMILFTILSVNFISDGLRDAFDPQSKA